MQDSKLAKGGLGKKSDIRMAKKLIQGLQGVDNKDTNEMKALMNEVLRGGYKPVTKAMGGKVQKMREGGSAMSDADRAMIQNILGESGKTISDADRARMSRMMGKSGKTISDADRAKMMMGMGKRMKMGGKVQKMNMGGQVMDTTKSMPVGMMDGGKVKKMNMGGVISGRGGKFKGMK